MEINNNNNNNNNNNRQYYSSPNIIGARWAGHLARIGETRSAYMVLVGKSEGKIPLGRSRCRWEGNSKMDIQEVGWTGLM